MKEKRRKTNKFEEKKKEKRRKEGTHPRPIFYSLPLHRQKEQTTFLEAMQIELLIKNLKFRENENDDYNEM